MKKQPDYRKALRDPYDASTLQNRDDGRYTSQIGRYRDPYSLDPRTTYPSKSSGKTSSKK